MTQNKCWRPAECGLIPVKAAAALCAHADSSFTNGLMTMKTDAQLQQDVTAELQWEPSINAAQIGVEVKDGIVTLAGHVSTFAEKRGAERAAQRVSGVRAMTVEMDVKLAGSNKRTDADIAGSNASKGGLDGTSFNACFRVLGVLFGAAVIVPGAHAQSRGELLYATHCITCHTSEMHWRDKEIGFDLYRVPSSVGSDRQDTAASAT